MDPGNILDGVIMTINMTDNDEKIINHTITRLLATREHSLHELRTKLTAKQFDSHLIEQQLDKFVANNVQSEQRFVESYIRSKANKGQGPMRIRMALREHQIDDFLIEQGVVNAEVDFYQIASQVYLKKYGGKPVEDWQDKQKRMRFLQYRGFDQEQIAEALKNPALEP